jgi:hypothetical protein
MLIDHKCNLEEIHKLDSRKVNIARILTDYITKSLKR